MYTYFIYVFAYMHTMCLHTEVQHSREFIQNMDVLLSQEEKHLHNKLHHKSLRWLSISFSKWHFYISWVLQCPRALYFLFPNISFIKFFPEYYSTETILTHFLKSCLQLDRYYVLSLDNK